MPPLPPLPHPLLHHPPCWPLAPALRRQPPPRRHRPRAPRPRQARWHSLPRRPLCCCCRRCRWRPAAAAGAARGRAPSPPEYTLQLTERRRRHLFEFCKHSTLACMASGSCTAVLSGTPRGLPWPHKPQPTPSPHHHTGTRAAPLGLPSLPQRPPPLPTPHAALHAATRPLHAASCALHAVPRRTRSLQVEDAALVHPRVDAGLARLPVLVDHAVDARHLKPAQPRAVDAGGHHRACARRAAGGWAALE